VVKGGFETLRHYLEISSQQLIRTQPAVSSKFLVIFGLYRGINASGKTPEETDLWAT